MRTSALLLTTLLLGATITAPLAYADAHGGAVATMATIVIGLKHFPSDADKTALAEIANGDSSDSAKAVANAIANISHKVSDADQATLAAIAADESEPADLRELAAIVGGINHMPSADAVAALQALASD